MSEGVGDRDLQSLTKRVLAAFPGKVSATFPPVDQHDAPACVLLTPKDPDAVELAVLHRFSFWSIDTGIGWQVETGDDYLRDVGVDWQFDVLDRIGQYGIVSKRQGIRRTVIVPDDEVSRRILLTEAGVKELSVPW